MIKLKKKLQYNKFYLILLLVCSVYVIVITQLIEYKSNFMGNETNIVGIIKKIDVKDNYFSLKVDSDEVIKANYYYKENEVKTKFIGKFDIGDIISLHGTLIEPLNNTLPNQFNYKKYLKNHKIYYIMNVDSYKILKKNTNLIYKIKNTINNRISLNSKTGKYIKTFILGDNKIDDDIKKIYQDLGISHLMAISGMHISILTSIVLFFLNKIKFKKNICYIITFIFLFFYMFLTNFTPSVLRSGTMFLALNINKISNLNISTIKVFIIVISILIFINPFIIYEIGFIYSTVISLYLILFSQLIKERKYYITKLVVTSFIAWIVSIPISIYNFYQINILSIFYNLIAVPIISYIIFPLSIIVFIFNRFDKLFLFFINIFETLSIHASKLNTNLILNKPNVIVIFIYFFVITLILYYQLKYKKNKIWILVLLMFIHYNSNYLFSSDYLLTLDVAQGDCFLLNYKTNVFLIDTGGSFYSSYYKNNKKITSIINTFKSLGIRKINYLIITHGDYDHMGDAINLVNNFKVKKVIFNCGELNELELDVIKVLDKKKIPYYSCIKELNINDNKLYFLNNKDYGNENDNSNVIYTRLNNHKFLFMGDAGIEVEEDLMEKYNFQNIDVLKVGHHGSNTSSSKKFIDGISPKYSLISVGKNNRYGHPNDIVLENLKESRIYRTDIDGSIMFKIKNNKLEIETYAP